MDQSPSMDGAKVEPGDTWTTAAARLGVDADALVAANGGVTARPLIVGEDLDLP